jgi:hypothetical protein
MRTGEKQMAKKAEVKQAQPVQESPKTVEDISTEQLNIAFGQKTRERTHLQARINQLNQECQLIDAELVKRSQQNQ